MLVALAAVLPARGLVDEALNDDYSDHPRMDRTHVMIGARLVELEREAVVRIHVARLEQPGIADRGVRFELAFRLGGASASGV
jgi:hypothetical protein